MVQTLLAKHPDLGREFKTIAEVFRPGATVLLVSGTNPDGDSLGTMAALYRYCEKRGVTALAFCGAPTPQNLTYLPLPKILHDPHELPQWVDAAVTFDLGHLSQTGVGDWLKGHAGTIVNIDHHQTNDHFGNINVVISSAASTTELVYNFFMDEGFTIDEATATALLTGLVTDTGNMSNPGATPSALAMAAHLVRCGGNLKEVLAHTFNNKSLNVLKLWGEVIEKLHHNRELGMTTAVISKEQFTNFDAHDEWVEGLANFLTILGETKAILVLREIADGIFKGSLRTTKDDVNVEALARAMGGGGHRKAAGFALRGILEKRKESWYIT